MNYDEMLISKLLRGETLDSEYWSYDYICSLAKLASYRSSNCIGICYAFGNQVSLVLENKDVSN